MNDLKVPFIILVIFMVFYFLVGIPAAEGAEFKPLTRDEPLVRMLLQEANNEPFMGMVAVAATAIDRAIDSRWPDTIRGVVYQPYQYSGMALKMGQYPPHQVERARLAIGVARFGTRPCGGGVFWYHTLAVSPSWDKKMVEACTIGNHVFFREQE